MYISLAWCLLASTALSACSNVGTFEPSRSPQRATSREATREYVYVTTWNDAYNWISAYAVNPGSGALTPVQGSPFAAGAYPRGNAVDPTANFAYVPTYDGNNVSAYAIAPSTGALSEIKGSPYQAGEGPDAIASIRAQPIANQRRVIERCNLLGAVLARAGQFVHVSRERPQLIQQAWQGSVRQIYDNLRGN